jgi:hypothetical protein
MMRHGRQWNKSEMRNSVAVAGARKSTSMSAVPVSALWMEEHRHDVVDEHGQRRRVEWEQQRVER